MVMHLPPIPLSPPSSQPVRCGQASAICCEQVCGAQLNCGQHNCTQVCHSGGCQPCQRRAEQGEVGAGGDLLLPVLYGCL